MNQPNGNSRTPSGESRTIAVDDDVFAALQSRAEPLVDDASSVLRTLLSMPSEAAAASSPAKKRAAKKATAKKRAAKKATAKKRPAKRAAKKSAVNKAAPKAQSKRAERGSLLPESEFEIPLLEAIDEQGGSVQGKQVLGRVGEKLGAKLGPLDREAVASGQIRWQSRVSFVRMRLIKSGDLKSDSPRGIWEITEAGRARLRPTPAWQQSAPPSAPPSPPAAEPPSPPAAEPPSPPAAEPPSTPGSPLSSPPPRHDW